MTSTDSAAVAVELEGSCQVDLTWHLRGGGAYAAAVNGIAHTIMPHGCHLTGRKAHYADDQLASGHAAASLAQEATIMQCIAVACQADNGRPLHLPSTN